VFNLQLGRVTLTKVSLHSWLDDMVNNFVAYIGSSNISAASQQSRKRLSLISLLKLRRHSSNQTAWAEEETLASVLEMGGTELGDEQSLTRSFEESFPKHIHTVVTTQVVVSVIVHKEYVAPDAEENSEEVRAHIIDIKFNYNDNILNRIANDGGQY